MNCSKPFPGQSEQMFKDKFCIWPKLMRTLVLISLIPPSAILFMAHKQLAPLAGLHDLLMITLSFNLLLLFWGGLLKLRSRKYWYRNYHIGKTMALAMIPVLASGYFMLSSPETPDMAQQHDAKAVYISLN